MTPRWSDPSGDLGVHRFRVWPEGTDSYSHSELAANFDEVDAIIGIPSSGDWPPSTGADGGIYKEVTLLQNERLPIGSIFYFFRPSTDVPLPNGCHVCDGTTLSPSDHDFPGLSGSVTLPDLRNSFILGADSAKAIGQAGAAVGTANIDTVLGAPGPQGSGGLNQITQAIAQMPSHNHGGSTGSWGTDTQAIKPGSVNIMHGFLNTGEIGSHTHSIPAQGGGQPMENRPRWIGLIALCKVKRITDL